MGISRCYKSELFFPQKASPLAFISTPLYTQLFPPHRLPPHLMKVIPLTQECHENTV